MTAARKRLASSEVISRRVRGRVPVRVALMNLAAVLLVCALASMLRAQDQPAQQAQLGVQAPIQLDYPPKPPQETGPPAAITLADAMKRAQKYNPDYFAALSDQKSAREDRLQARNARLPQLGFRSEYLGTQGNGLTPNGRYVTNDGVHVYREWATFHQDLTANVFMGNDYKKAQAAEAITAAKAEIARRGLTVTVTKSFYALVVAQRKYATAQEALEHHADDRARPGRDARRDLGGNHGLSEVVFFAVPVARIDDEPGGKPRGFEAVDRGGDARRRPVQLARPRPDRARRRHQPRDLRRLSRADGGARGLRRRVAHR